MVKPPKIRFHTHFNKKSLSIKPLFCDFVDKLKHLVIDKVLFFIPMMCSDPPTAFLRFVYKLIKL
ncbi:hypothetical protein BLDA23_05455 [Bacillus licheniformis]|nr:hypothetical protein BLDA23_05455 [Bacillus licheniformis]